MAQPNFADKTLWTGDNLDILRGINSECVDLIYLDPPFNSNRDYAAPVGSAAAGAAFKDTWTLSDLDVAWMGIIADERPPVANVIKTAGITAGQGMQSYLTMMAVRLLELHRILAPAGSIYLHCDPTAGHYLKLLMDAIFGRVNCRNEIAWQRTTSKGNASKRFAQNFDILLFYAKSEATKADIFQPYDLGNLDEKTLDQYALKDAEGRRYTLDNLANPNRNRPNLTYEFLGITRVWRWTQERMQSEYDAGRIVQRSPDSVPRFKRYLDEQRGIPLGNFWADVPPPRGMSEPGSRRRNPLLC